MGVALRFVTTAQRRADTTPALSHRVVGQLQPAEQFVLWAFRQRAVDGLVPSRVLLEGFRLAFDTDVLAPALAGFEGLRACLGHGSGRGPWICPLRCACMTADEERLIAAVAAAQHSDAEACREAVGSFLAIPQGRLFWHQVTVFAFSLARAGLLFPAYEPATTPADTTLH